MRVALVHDYLIQDGGAERVLLAMRELFPDAPIYTLFHNAKHSHTGFNNAKVIPSKLNNLPFAKTHYQWYLPFMAEAVESFDFSGFDLVLSSSSSFAKGIIVPPETRHVCYCHTPTRFLWHERVGYLNELPQPKFIKTVLPPLLYRLRQWDRQAAERPDDLLTNSRTSRERIRRYYGRDATVIHPPVDVASIPLSTTAGSFWLAGGRLVSYKRFDLIVRAFAHLNLPLKIFGQGPEEKKLKRLAGPKTEFLGRVDDATKINLYQNAIGFIHPQVEDFGITAVEAMAAGKPVLAFGKGGATETVLPGVSGQFFDVQCWEDLGDAIIRFDPRAYDPSRIRAHAEQFSKAEFLKNMRAYIGQTARNGNPSNSPYPPAGRAGQGRTCPIPAPPDKGECPDEIGARGFAAV